MVNVILATTPAKHTLSLPRLSQSAGARDPLKHIAKYPGGQEYDILLSLAWEYDVVGVWAFDPDRLFEDGVVIPHPPSEKLFDNIAAIAAEE